MTVDVAVILTVAPTVAPLLTETTPFETVATLLLLVVQVTVFEGLFLPATVAVNVTDAPCLTDSA